MQFNGIMEVDKERMIVPTEKKRYRKVSGKLTINMKQDEKQLQECSAVHEKRARAIGISQMNDCVEETAESIRPLLEAAQNGSQEACVRLLSQYRPLLRSLCSKFALENMSQQDREDLREEAERIFLCAVSTYDLSQDGVEFGLYAKICLRNGLVSELRRFRRRSRLNVVPVSDEMVGEDDPAEYVVEEERFRQLYGEVRSRLSAFENRVWWLFVSGMSCAQIAERVGRDERSVYNAVYRIRKKLRNVVTETEG